MTFEIVFISLKKCRVGEKEKRKGFRSGDEAFHIPLPRRRATPLKFSIISTLLGSDPTSKRHLSYADKTPFPLQ
jgi:hypothetical protein